MCHATSSHILPSSKPSHLILSHPMSFRCVHHSIRAMVTKHWLCSGLSFHACRIPASVMLGFAPPEKIRHISPWSLTVAHIPYHVPSHIVPLFLLIYPPLDWRSHGQSTMKMNSLRSHGFYIAILIVRYITIKSLSH